MTLRSAVDRVSRPAAGAALLLLVASAVVGSEGDRTERLDRYPVLYWSAVAMCGVLLVAVLATPQRLQRSIRTGALVGAGILAALVAGNGLSAGVAQIGFAVVAAGALLVALPAMIDRFEELQNRSVRRL